VVGQPNADIPPDSDVRISVEGEDVAGHALSGLTIPVHTPPRVVVMIDEIVPTPYHDWNDSDGIGVPFDEHAGTGQVTTADQWVELINLSNVALDLTTAGIVFRTIDQSPTDTPLDFAVTPYFGDGGSIASWWPG
jgi:hypothetical protein